MIGITVFNFIGTVYPGYFGALFNSIALFSWLISIEFIVSNPGKKPKALKQITNKQ